MDPSNNALVLCNRLPFPLDDGWKRRTFHIIRGIAAEYHVTLIVYHDEKDAQTVRGERHANTLRTLDVRRQRQALRKVAQVAPNQYLEWVRQGRISAEFQGIAERRLRMQRR